MPRMFGNLSIRPKLAAVAGRAVAAVHELQEERARAVAWSAAGAADGLAARRGRVDRTLAAYRATAAGLDVAGDPPLARAAAGAAARLDRLPVVRAEVDRRLLTPERVMADLDQMIARLLGVAGQLAEDLDGPAAARADRLLLAVAAAKEATGRERSLLAAVPTGTGEAGAAGTGQAQQPPAGTGPGRGPGNARAAPPGARAREEALAVRLTAAAAVARHELAGAAAGDRLGRIDRALAVPGARRVQALELALLQPATDPPALGDLRAWRDGLAVRAAALRRVERGAAADLEQAAWAWQRRLDRRARDRLVPPVAVALATLAAGLLVLGRLARRPAGPAAAAATVGGLAHRGQALAEHQLQLLEELVRGEPDPHRRRGLLGVDQLANRLRRTTETLLAMTGPDRAGSASGPGGRPSRGAS